MKTVITIALIISVCLNFWFLVSWSPSTTGGGKFSASPNEKLVVSASSLIDENSQICDGERFAEIEVKSAKVVNGNIIDGDLLKRVRIWPIKDRSYRGMNGLLTWSDDSKAVTIRSSDYELTLKLDQGLPNKQLTEQVAAPDGE